MSFSPGQRSLAELVAETDGAILRGGDPRTRIAGVTQDTRRLVPGELFVAVPGLEHDGARFAGEALARGAAALVVEDPAKLGFDASGVPLVRVPHARRALADLAAAFF